MKTCRGSVSMGFKISVLTMFFILIPGMFPLYSQEGNCVIFAEYSGRAAQDSALSLTEIEVRRVLYETGRLMPVEDSLRNDALRSSNGKDSVSLYEQAALKLKVKRYFVFRALVVPGRSVLNVTVFLKEGGDFRREMERNIYTWNHKNIPIRGALFVADYVSSLPIRAAVVSKEEGRVLLLDRGQWSGLRPGIYSVQGGRVKILSTTRFSSRAVMEEGSASKTITFPITAETSYIKNRLEDELLSNDVAKLGIDSELEKRGNPVRESIMGTCLINMGANACMPIYGSFLATEYFGFKNSKPHLPGLFIGAGLLVAQLGAVPIHCESIDVFFPWGTHSKRSHRERNMQIGLWATIPLLYTASYLHQLSWQLETRGMLPPVFMNHNVAASLLSFFVPGGGLFYKGYRYGGWLLYSGEVGLLSYSLVKGGGHAKRGYILLGVVKTLDIWAAAILRPSYGVYKREYGRTSFDIYMSPDMAAGPKVGLRVMRSF